MNRKRCSQTLYTKHVSEIHNIGRKNCLNIVLQSVEGSSLSTSDQGYLPLFDSLGYAQSSGPLPRVTVQHLLSNLKRV